MKAHDLPRNSVVAVCYSTGAVSAFLYINSRDQISPFWYSGRSPYNLETFGELNKFFDEEPGGHEHWRNGLDYHNVRMVQGHVTSAAKVDFKRCKKFAKKH